MTTQAEIAAEQERRQAAADATGLFEQLQTAAELPDAASLENNPIIQRLPSSLEGLNDATMLDEQGNRVVVPEDKIPGDVSHEMPRNTVEGGALTFAGQTFTGKRVVFRTDTGQPVPVLTYFLPTVIKKIRDDGKLAFTFQDPGFRPPKGQFPCYLNAKAPESEAFHRMGLPACPADALPSEVDRDDHMIHRHSSEWRRIEDIRVRTERAEDREQNRVLREALAQSLTSDNPTLSPTPVVEEAAPVASSATEGVDFVPTAPHYGGGAGSAVAEPVDPKPFKSQCLHCDKMTEGKSQGQADNFMRMHSKKHEVTED